MGDEPRRFIDDQKPIVLVHDRDVGQLALLPDLDGELPDRHVRPGVEPVGLAETLAVHGHCPGGYQALRRSPGVDAGLGRDEPVEPNAVELGGDRDGGHGDSGSGGSSRSSRHSP